MSVDAVAWALRWAPVTNAQEHVLLIALADRADEYGRAAWPFQADLAARGRCSIRTVRRHLTAMEKRGLITRGDQRLVAHMRPDQRPIVWDLDMSQRVSEAVFADEDEGASNERPDNLSRRFESTSLASSDRPDNMTGRTNGESDARNDRPDEMTARTELCPSDRTELCPPIRPERPPSSAYVGEDSYVSNARELEPPPPSCSKHSTFVAGCPDCETTSAAREQWLNDRIAATEPPRYCPRHPTGTDLPCRDCQALRVLHDQWRQNREDALNERRRSAAVEQSAAARSAATDRASAIAECGMCDAEGRIDGWVCGHDPARMPKPGRGAAAIRQARCQMCDADGRRLDGTECDHNVSPPDPSPSVSVPTGRSESASHDESPTQENQIHA